MYRWSEVGTIDRIKDIMMYKINLNGQKWWSVCIVVVVYSLVCVYHPSPYPPPPYPLVSLDVQ